MYADGPGAPVALVGQLASTAHCAVNAKHSSWGLVSAGCRAVCSAQPQVPEPGQGHRTAAPAGAAPAGSRSVRYLPVWFPEGNQINCDGSQKWYKHHFEWYFDHFGVSFGHNGV